MEDEAGPVPLLECFRALPLAQQQRLLHRHGEAVMVAGLSGEGSLRNNQRPPDGDWTIWVILAGRGFGKTHAGAEWVHALAAAAPRRIALVAPTLDVARSVMVEGESGLLSRVPAGLALTWQPHAKRLLWSNGSEARLYSGGEPDALRGGQFDIAWGDEFAHWARGEDMVMNLRMATRLGATGAGVSLGRVPGYALTGDHADLMAATMESLGCRRLKQGRPGDLIAFELAQGHRHLAVLSETGMIHAHAGLGRVVEAPVPTDWPVAAIWALPGVR